MRLKDMISGGQYVVTKGGTTLKVGDHLRLDADGCIMCQEAQGWLVPAEWSRLRNRVEVDVEWYEKKIKGLREASFDMERILNRMLEHQKCVKE